MAMVNRKLKFFINSPSFYNDPNREKSILYSDREYFMPEEGWNLDSYVDLIEKLEEELDCYFFEQWSKGILNFEIFFPDNDKRSWEEKMDALKKIVWETSSFFERMERLGVML